MAKVRELKTIKTKLTLHLWNIMFLTVWIVLVWMVVTHHSETRNTER